MKLTNNLLDNQNYVMSHRKTKIKLGEHFFNWKNLATLFLSLGVIGGGVGFFLFTMYGKIGLLGAFIYVWIIFLKVLFNWLFDGKSILQISINNNGEIIKVDSLLEGLESNKTKSKYIIYIKL